MRYVWRPWPRTTFPTSRSRCCCCPRRSRTGSPKGIWRTSSATPVDTLDLGALHARYDKDGPRNQPFHPAMMVKVLVYGYATGVFSSRKIARKLHEQVVRLAREMGLVRLARAPATGLHGSRRDDSHRDLTLVAKSSLDQDIS